MGHAPELEMMLEFPEEWQRPPRAYRLAPGWQDWIVNDQGLFRLDVNVTIQPFWSDPPVRPEDVILIQSDDGDDVQRLLYVMIEERNHKLKPFGSATPGILEETPLFSLMVSAQNE